MFYGNSDYFEIHEDEYLAMEEYYSSEQDA